MYSVADRGLKRSPGEICGRRIYTDGRDFPMDFEPSFMGYVAAPVDFEDM